MILYALIFILFEIVIGLSFALYFTYLRIHKMALNFALLQAAAAAVTTDANDLQTQAASSDDASNQAAIDAVTTSLNSAHASCPA